MQHALNKNLVVGERVEGDVPANETRPVAGPDGVAALAALGAELVIGLVGAIGTDLTAAWRVLRRELEDVAYEAHLIHLSKILRNEVPGYETLPETPFDIRIEQHMAAGDEFREFAAEAELKGVMAALANRAM